MKPPVALIGPKNTRFSNIRIVDETGSTNSDLLNAEENGSGARVLIAKHQSAGRGRSERTWQDIPGNSLLISVADQYLQDKVHLLPMVAGLTILNMFERLCEYQFDLKWPNDVLYQRRKIAGILVEAKTRADKTQAVIGCGINLKGKPSPELMETATTFSQVCDLELSVVQAANYFLIELESQLQQLQNRSETDLVDSYRSRCSTIGAEVQVDTSSGVVSGIAQDIGLKGQLLVKTSSGSTIEVFSGDAHLRNKS